MTRPRSEPTTTKPFREALAELLRENDYTTQTGNVNWHAFARDMEATATDDTIGYESLRKALAGKRNVTPRMIEECARVLRIPATYFVEYRAYLAARDFDVREVGFEQVLTNLERWGIEQRPAAKRTRRRA